MTTVARVTAQAKINLVLRVLGREDSGFHQIETVFLRLELADDITVRVSSGRALDCRGPALPVAGLGDPLNNLAFRAAAAYADATGWPNGFEISLEKRIPVGAGLGGGSADAGAVLRALDAMNPNPLGTRLPELAATLGADVPFLSIESPMALGWGRGDRLLPLPVLERREVVLVVPPFGVSTAEAYAWLDAYPSPRPVGVLEPAALATWQGITPIACNDFEPVVAARHPEIAKAVDALRGADASLAMMSGSGSVVFGIFDRAVDGARVSAESGGEIVATRTATRVVRVETNG